MQNRFAHLIPGQQQADPYQAPPMRQIVPPQPKTPTPQTPEVRESTIAGTNNARREGVLKDMEIEREREKLRQMEGAKDVTGELINVIDSTARAHLISRRKPLATGTLVTPLYNKIPGTPGRDLEGLLSTIGSNTAFDRLQKMREASPTGGALGAITERELDLLKNTIASLDTSQTDAEFQRNMQKVQAAYARTLMKVPGGKEAFKEWRKRWSSEQSPKQKPKEGWSIEAVD